MSDLVKAAGSRVDLVKMDIEGAELDVLTENNEWLRADVIVMEFTRGSTGPRASNK